MKTYNFKPLIDRLISNITSKESSEFIPKLYKSYNIRGFGGLRGKVFNQELFNADSEVLNIIKKLKEIAKHLFGENSLNNKKSLIELTATARDKTKGINILDNLYKPIYTKSELFELNKINLKITNYKNLMSKLNLQLDNLSYNSRFYKTAEEAPDFTEKGWDIIDYAREHPEYIIDTWKKTPNIYNFTSGEFPPSTKIKLDMNTFLKWYENDVYPRIQKSATDNGEFMGSEKLKHAFDDLVLEIVDIPKTDFGGWANDKRIAIIANLFGLHPSTFVHELHHFLRTKLENPIFRKSLGKLQDSTKQIVNAILDTTEKGSGYTLKEANILDEAYTFLLDYIDKKGISPIREKGATNTELRYNIAQAFKKDGVPASGKELDKIIDNLSDEELFNFMFRSNNLNISYPMNGYMANFMDNLYVLHEGENVLLPNGGTHYQTPITFEYIKEKMPAIKKALKYVGGVSIPTTLAYNSMPEYKFGGQFKSKKLIPKNLPGSKLHFDNPIIDGIVSLTPAGDVRDIYEGIAEGDYQLAINGGIGLAGTAIGISVIPKLYKAYKLSKRLHKAANTVKAYDKLGIKKFRTSQGLRGWLGRSKFLTEANVAYHQLKNNYPLIPIFASAATKGIDLINDIKGLNK